eukprot:2945202-Heterocapsa_arctica.AAC.1
MLQLKQELKKELQAEWLNAEPPKPLPPSPPPRDYSRLLKSFEAMPAPRRGAPTRVKHARGAGAPCRTHRRAEWGSRCRLEWNR